MSSTRSRRFPRPTLLAFASVLMLAGAAPLAAQFSPVPNSGCPGGSAITTSGTPQLGFSISYTWFCTARSHVPFMLFGPAVPPVFQLPAVVACSAGCTVIHPAPPLLLPGPAGRGLMVPLTIPQDVSLIGQTIHTQGGCLGGAMNNCIYLGAAVATQIM